MKIEIPDDICDRARALGLDVETFVTESLRRAVARMEEDMKEAAQKQAAKPELKRGRPPKDAGRIPVTLYIEKPWYDRLSAMAKRTGMSKGDCLNKVLADAAAAGILPTGTNTHG